MARNGYLAEDGIRLVTVEDDDQLIATAAAAYRAWKAASIAAGRPIFIAEPAGAYRSAWVQNDMVDNPWRYNLNPRSVIKFGRTGQSHGWGNRVDIGGDLAWAIANAARFGWTREYGTRDPNHFAHDGRTATAGAGFGGGGITIDLGDEEVTYGIRNDFPNEAILPGLPKGAVLIGSGTDPLVWVGNHGPEQVNGVEIASWTAQQIADRINQVGIRGSGADLNKVFKSLKDARAGVPVYVLGATGGAPAAGDTTAVVAELQKISARLGQIGTPVENAAAFFAEQKKAGN